MMPLSLMAPLSQSHGKPLTSGPISVMDLSTGFNFTTRPAEKGVPEREPLGAAKVQTYLSSPSSFQLLTNESESSPRCSFLQVSSVMFGFQYNQIMLDYHNITLMDVSMFECVQEVVLKERGARRWQVVGIESKEDRSIEPLQAYCTNIPVAGTLHTSML